MQTGHIPSLKTARPDAHRCSETVRAPQEPSRLFMYDLAAAALYPDFLPRPMVPTYDSVMNIRRPQCPVLSWFLVRCSFCLAGPASLCPLKNYTCPQPVLGKYRVNESMNLQRAETRTVQCLMGGNSACFITSICVSVRSRSHDMGEVPGSCC